MDLTDSGQQVRGAADLLAILADEFGIELADADDNATLVDIGLDSLSVLEVVVFLEDSFPPFVVHAGEEPSTIGELRRLITRIGEQRPIEHE